MGEQPLYASRKISYADAVGLEDGWINIAWGVENLLLTVASLYISWMPICTYPLAMQNESHQVLHLDMSNLKSDFTLLTGPRDMPGIIW